MDGKNVVVVGSYSELQQHLISSIAKQTKSITLIEWDKHTEFPIPLAQQSHYINELKSQTSKLYNITGDLCKISEWEKISQEIKKKVKTIDHFIYLSAVGFEQLFVDSSPETIKNLFEYNFNIPVIALNVFLRIFKKSKTHLSIFINFSDQSRYQHLSTLYYSSKTAFVNYAKQFTQLNRISSTVIQYTSTSEFIKIINNKLTFVPEAASNIEIVTEKILQSISRKEAVCNPIENEKLKKIKKYKGYAFDFPIYGMDKVNTVNPLCLTLLEPNKTHELKEYFKATKKQIEDGNGRNSFHYAAYSGNYYGLDFMLNILIKQNYKKTHSVIDHQDNFKWSPLHVACKFGHIKIIRRLLKDSADVNLLTINGFSPLHYFVCSFPTEVVVSSLSNSGGGSLPTSTSNHGNLDALSLSGSGNIPNPNSHHARVSDKSIPVYLQLLKSFIDLGADVNQKNYFQMTPIHFCSIFSFDYTLEVLLKNDPDIHRKTLAGVTALYYAVLYDNETIVKMLLEAGADPSNCLEISKSESIRKMLEAFKEKNKRDDSNSAKREREIVYANSVEEVIQLVDKQYKLSENFPDKKVLLDNSDIFITALRFVSKKNYHFPGKKMEKGHHSKVKSKAMHKLSLDKISEELISNGNPRKLFKLFEQIGKGGFGAVYSAKRIEDKRQFAIKRVPHYTKKEKWSNLDEIHFLKLSSSRSIVKYYQSFISRDELWIVMEYLQGGCLSEVVMKWNLTEPQIAFVATQILKGLERIHSKNLIHRDLKSGNIMLSIFGDVKIIDFGLCTEIGSQELVHIVGSPFWIPPEMIRKMAHGPPADIWSLGILCIEMADGLPPNRDSSLKAMFNTGIGVPPTLKDPSKWSKAFINFLNRMLQFNPADRASASELLKDPWFEKAADKESLQDILHQVFLEDSIENSLGFSI